MFKLTPLIRLSSGLVFLTVSILLLADVIGIAPNHSELVIDERRKLAEFLTIQVVKSIDSGQENTIPSMMNTIYKRNDDILSLAIRKIDGEILLEVGDHSANWHRSVADDSTADYIQVPIFRENIDWGRIEIRYRSLNKAKNYVDLPIDNSMLLIVFVSLLGYVLFSLFLKRTLKYLDPSAVIPARVKNAMNALSEGVLILDNRENIILANSSFCEKVGLSEKKLIGSKINKLLWRTKNNSEHSNDILPWSEVLKNNISVSSVALCLDIPEQGNRTFMVNASPVEDDKKNVTGMLCTFDDVTHIEEKNNELETAMSLLKKSQVEISKKNEELSILASIDPLTGCLNRRAFFDVVNEEFSELENTKTMACIMLDIDFFKRVNDNYGHTIGDTVIRSLAATLKSTLRENDLLCRYGGEEFCVILRDTTDDVAQSLAERTRKKVEELQFNDSPATKNMKITASFGITDTRSDAKTIEELVDQADQALYLSKERGRNKVSLWEDVLSSDGTDTSTNISNIHDIETQTSLGKTDVLTGLLDRPSFMKVVQEAIMNKKNNDDLLAVILIDIDMFKRINRSMGSEQGDLILTEFANRLNTLIRGSDSLAHYDEYNKLEPLGSRLSGNTFALLAKNFKSLSNVESIAERLLSSLSKPFLISTTEVHLTFSLGISFYPNDGRKSEVLVGNAEMAMLRAKKEEGSTVRLYSEEKDATLKDTMSDENELRNAIKNREFIVHYQPKVNLKDNSINSVEALVRWNHPTRGVVMPGEFIPLAESCGLMHLIGQQVMEIAFQQTAKWVDDGYPSIRVAINISALQLKKQGFFEETVRLFELFKCSPKNIEFELTETILVENIDFVLSLLTRFHDMGLSISIDDFGVGYSSLNYIKRLPVDVIKIDKSFIDDMHTDENDATLVSAIISMAHAMKFLVVAEGVEHKQQFDILKNLGCDFIQGYYFSKPLSFEKYSELLRENNIPLLAMKN